MKDLIDNAITNIDSKHIDETISDIINNKSTKNNVSKVIFKTTVAIAAIIALLVVSFTVAVAEGNYTAYQILNSFNPTIAQTLTRVNESCIDNGIKMTVEAVNISGCTADILVSIQDIEKDRIDETTDLFDSYRIHTTSDSECGCFFISYDENSKTAMFLINIEQEEPIKGGKITFSVSELLSGKKDVNCELDITEELNATYGYVDSLTLPVRGGSGKEDFNPDESHDILNTSLDKSFSPTPCVQIVGYGFIDNKLHIQAYYENILDYDNHGYVYLANPQGIIYPEYDIAFWDDDKKGSFEEYVYDISPKEFESCRVYGEFVTCENRIEGKWKVKFLLHEK